jgi:hypothetical protein
MNGKNFDESDQGYVLRAFRASDDRIVFLNLVEKPKTGVFGKNGLLPGYYFSENPEDATVVSDPDDLLDALAWITQYAHTWGSKHGIIKESAKIVDYTSRSQFTIL